MLIGELSRMTGLSRDTIRFYEKSGLIELRRKDRLANNYRDYPESTLERLRQIQVLKDCGFTLEEARDLIGSWESGDVLCQSLRETATQRLAIVRDRMKVLQRAEKSLAKTLDDCQPGCGQSEGLPTCIASNARR